MLSLAFAVALSATSAAVIGEQELASGIAGRVEERRDLWRKFYH
jgi:hypothetical protein